MSRGPVKLIRFVPFFFFFFPSFTRQFSRLFSGCSYVGHSVAISRWPQIEYPQMWVWPQVPLGGPPPPPPPPCALGPLPPTSLGRPLPEPCKKSQGWGGRRGKERAGREGVWLEGRFLQLQWGMGGDLPNTSPE